MHNFRRRSPKKLARVAEEEDKVREAHKRGLPDAEMAQELGFKQLKLARIRRRLGLPSNARPRNVLHSKEEQISMRLREGQTQESIAQELKVSSQTIWKVKKRLGMEFRALRKVTPDVEQKIVEMVKKGESSYAIRTALGISSPTLIAAKKRLGLAYQRRRGNEASPEIEQRVVDLWKQGLPVAAIALELHIQDELVQSIRAQRDLGNVGSRRAGSFAEEMRLEGYTVVMQPSRKRRGRRTGISTDDSFAWVKTECVESGQTETPLEEWRRLAEAYMRYCHTPAGPKSFQSRLFSVGRLLKGYIWKHRFCDPSKFFSLPRNVHLPQLIGVNGGAAGEEPFPDKEHGVVYAGYACDWLDWILATEFSSDEEGPKPIPIPGYWMPVDRPHRKDSTPTPRDETNKLTLPWKYIRRLRGMLAEGPNFCDWKWAQKATGFSSGLMSGDWFRVYDESKINWNDPDCVVRKQRRAILNYQLPPERYDITKHRQSVVGYDEFYEMWSPVSAVALLVKLEMPFRTFQVRMLDSGETDVERPDIDEEEEKHFLESDGKDVSERHQAHCPLFRWVSNSSERARLLEGLNLNDRTRVGESRGVFAKHTDKDAGGDYVGFFINTNKTADIAVSWKHRGYTVRFQHHSLHRWLIKLRRWQQRYNPVEKPTLWTSLEPRHLGGVRKKDADLAGAPPTCFLFRDASALGKRKGDLPLTNDEQKPITNTKVNELWIKLLASLEKMLAENGSDKEKAWCRFIKTWEPGGYPSAIYYPLHALRVSLITALADGGMKLETLMHLAGHTRLVMTIYYIKQNHYVINKQMREANEKLAQEEDVLLIDWLMNKSYESLGSAIAVDQEGLRLAIARNPKDRTSVHLERHLGGWCLVGGNVAPSSEDRQVGGCFNGGPLIGAEKSQKRSELHEGVRPKACIESGCRWFATRQAYVFEIKARMDLLSTNLSLAQQRREKAEDDLSALETEQYRAEIGAAKRREELAGEGLGGEAARVFPVFTKRGEIETLNRVVERYSAEVDYLLVAIEKTSNLLDRVFALAARPIENRESGDDLIAQGSAEDVRQAIAPKDPETLSLIGISGGTTVSYVREAVATGNDERRRLWALEPVSELSQMTSVALNAESYPELENESFGPILRRSQLLDNTLSQIGFDVKFSRLTPGQQLRLGNRLLNNLAQSFGDNMKAVIEQLEGSEPMAHAVAERLKSELSSDLYGEATVRALMSPAEKP